MRMRTSVGMLVGTRLAVPAGGARGAAQPELFDQACKSHGLEYVAFEGEEQIREG